LDDANNFPLDEQDWSREVGLLAAVVRRTPPVKIDFGTLGITQQAAAPKAILQLSSSNRTTHQAQKGPLKPQGGAHEMEALSIGIFR
jgi:hypothetical protein